MQEEERGQNDSQRTYEVSIFLQLGRKTLLNMLFVCLLLFVVKHAIATRADVGSTATTATTETTHGTTTSTTRTPTSRGSQVGQKGWTIYDTHHHTRNDADTPQHRSYDNTGA